MIWLLFVIMLIVLIAFFSKGNKKKKLEIEEIQANLNKKPAVSDELIKLKKLLDDGVITEDEFNKQKGIILG